LRDAVVPSADLCCIFRNAAQAGGSVSAYVTFSYKDDAKAAIQALDGFWFDSHLLRASFGTTKVILLHLS
jgi:hypothetical protein